MSPVLSIRKMLYLVAASFSPAFVVPNAPAVRAARHTTVVMAEACSMDPAVLGRYLSLETPDSVQAEVRSFGFQRAPCPDSVASC